MPSFIKIRNINRKKIVNSLLNSPYLKGKIDFYYENELVTPSWFGLSVKDPCHLQKVVKNIIIKKLENNGIETRPIISGNFANQPAAKIYGLTKNQKFPNTDLQFMNKVFLLAYLPKK